MERHVGRLGEIRIVGSLLVSEMSIYRARFASMLQAVPGPLVFANDLRAAESIAPEVERQGVELMRAATLKVERAAMLVSRKGVFGLQMLRATMQTDGHVRRVFADEHEAVAWLDEVLTPDERVRLRAFFKHAALR
jgi:hypothetical protein